MTIEKEKIDKAFKKFLSWKEIVPNLNQSPEIVNIVQFFCHYHDNGWNPGVSDLFMIVRQVDMNLLPYYFESMNESQKHRFRNNIEDLIKLALMEE